jgi:hypothetical protein
VADRSGRRSCLRWSVDRNALSYAPRRRLLVIALPPYLFRSFFEKMKEKGGESRHTRKGGSARNTRSYSARRIPVVVEEGRIRKRARHLKKPRTEKDHHRALEGVCCSTTLTVASSHGTPHRYANQRAATLSVARAFLAPIRASSVLFWLFSSPCLTPSNNCHTNKRFRPLSSFRRCPWLRSPSFLLRLFPGRFMLYCFLASYA